MAGGPEPIDRARLAILAEAGGGSDLVVELVDLFVDDVPNRLAAIRAALDAGDPDALVRAAHSLKGSASTMGADHMAALCVRMEQHGRDGAVAPAAAVLPDLEGEFERVRQALDAWVAAL